MSRPLASVAPASLPPAGLAGLDPRFSRLVTVPVRPRPGQRPDDGAAPAGQLRQPVQPSEAHVWHVLDNGPVLDEAGVRPRGTILCVHGNPTWSYLWRRIVTAATEAALATGPAADAVGGPWRVVAVDQLEMGFSERTGRERTLADRVRDLGDLTAALGLDAPGSRVVTLGHDWGGAVSLGWAVDHPDALVAVAVLNTAVHQPEDASVPAPLLVARRPALLPQVTVRTPAFLETTLALAQRPLPDGVKDGYRAPYRTAARRAGIGAFVADIPVDAGHVSAPELDRIADGVTRLAGLDVPALLLWGPRDPIFADRYLADLARRLPHADVHRMVEAGHLVAEDEPYAGVVLGWLGRVLGTGATASSGGEAAAGAEPSTSPVASAPEPSRTRPPLWHQLDALRDSHETALVEMAPPTGPAPRLVSWRLLSRRVREVAVGLARSGVRPGDRVLLLVPPGADLTTALYACLRIGAVVVVADASLGVRALSRLVHGAGPDHVIGEAKGLAAARALRWSGSRVSTQTLPGPLASALGVQTSLPELVALGATPGAGRLTGPPSDADLPPEPAEDDVAAVLFTSGSTGPAKGVVYTHGQLAAMRDALAGHYGIGVGTGLVAGFAPFALLGPALGTRSVTPDMDVSSPRTLTASAVAAAARAVDATMVFLSPAALTNVVATTGALTAEDHAALGRVELVLSAGAPVPPSLLAEAVDLMPRAVAHTPYGMTEALLLADVTLDEIRAAGDGTTSSGVSAGAGAPAAGGVCVGRPTAGTRVLLSPLDDDGRATGELTDAAGVTGEIVVSAPHLKLRYDRLHLTDEAAVRGTPGPRWHRTGDVGHLDGEGRLWVEGRLAHVLVTPDGVLTPVAAELRIGSVPEVARAALVGVGPRGTQQAVAVVETVPPARRPHVAPELLAAQVRGAAGVPLAAVLVVPGLPTDIRHNSKIDRALLAGWAEGVLGGGRLRAP